MSRDRFYIDSCFFCLHIQDLAIKFLSKIDNI